MSFEECIKGINDKYERIVSQAVDGGYSQAYIDAIDERVVANKNRIDDSVDLANLAISKANAIQIGQSSASIGYATLSDLNNDLSRDDGTLAIVTNDANSANNGTYRKVGASGTGSWVQSSYDRVALVENALKYKADLSIGKNLFNPDEAELGFYVLYTDGTLRSNSGYNASGYIPIVDGNSYTLSYQSYLAWYDANKVYISGVDSGSNATQVAPANAHFLRCSIPTGSYQFFQVEEGIAATSYEPYKKTLDSSYFDYSDSRNITVIEDTVTPMLEKKVDKKFTRNMFDKSVALIGYYIDNNGGQYSSTDYNVSDFISVTSGNDYVANQSLRFTCYYDSSRNVVAGGASTAVAAGTVITIPANVAYIRVTFSPSAMDELQFEMGSTSTAYISYGTYFDASIIPDNGLVAKQLDIFVPTKNLFDKSKVVLDEFVNEIGGVSASTSYVHSDFIKVKENSDYIFSSSCRFTTFYDINKAVVSGGSSVATTTTFIPAGVAYMIVSFYPENIATLQIEEGTDVTSYQPYSLTVADEKGNPIGIKEVAVETDAVIAPTQYVIDNGQTTNFYAENMAYNTDETKVNLSASGLVHKGRSIELTNKQNGTNINAVAELYNDTFSASKDKSLTIRVADKNKTTAVTIQNIGDSYTGRMTWANTILNDATASQSLNFVGLRNAGVAPIKCDGQGGWTWDAFFTVNVRDAFSQFMHPVNDFLYYGTTEFWINANSSNPTYNASTFDDAKLLFDATTGFKKSPNVNDVMQSGGIYKKYDGTSWVSVDETTDLGGFAWNYQKYLNAWNITAPDIVHILLGTNDFAGASEYTFDTAYSTYIDHYNNAIASIQTAVPTAKIVVGIPVSSGKQGGIGTPTTERRHKVFKVLAKNLIRDFANREAENIYLLDYHSVVDRIYGFPLQNVKPYSDFTETNTEVYLEDTVHLGFDGFAQMGNAYMAMIQELR